VSSHTESAAEEFYGLLVPLADERLIVPRACVAEVIAWQTPATMDGAPAWYVGTIAWSGRTIPVVSFEGTLGRTIPQPTGRTRIVVLQCLGSRLQAGCFGLLTQGFPQLVRLNADVVKPDLTRSFPERSPVLCGVRMVNEAPLVPDLEYLEGLIADETSVPA
jgi:chemosensory pili system protein ChpC